MADAFIYDAVRTPRGLGKPGGGLHTLAPIDLAATVLTALRERTGFDRAEVEDVIFGVGDGVDDQGADIARSAVIRAVLDHRIAGSTVSRFCAVLGSTAGDIALTLGARGGVFIAGGIAPRIIDILEKSPFRERFESKGRLSGYTKDIPTHVILHPHTALIGAAVALTPEGRAAVSVSSR